ncbi:MAG: fibrobacter succinogenes major paralogous domain-containing protein [Prolixibacteraceae bacterium]
MRKPLFIGFFFTAILLLLVSVLSCKKEPLKQVPFLISSPANNVGPTVTSGGNITSEGSSPVLSRGVCWSIKTNPTNKNKDSITSDGTGIGIFTSSITGLKPGTTYFIRAYATNEVGTAYGNEVAVVMAATIPVLTTLAISAISDSIVNSGGTISNNGGAQIAVRGVCWSTIKNPTITDFVTTDGSGTGAFNSTVTGIIPSMTYYLRAYATNSAGTGYGNEFSFSLAKTLVKDMDGNFYHFAKIGSQVWMTENLRSTRFRDSTSITLVDNATSWSNQIGPGYCWYGDDEVANKSKYGALYNWYAVNSGKLCPTGWHVPTDTEWTTLTTFLGGEPLAGGKLKESGIVHWITPNASATNESGFTALPGGYRLNSGIYGNMGIYGNWWTTTSVLANVANYRYLYYGNASVTKSFISQKSGLSVRCLKN